MEDFTRKAQQLQQQIARKQELEKTIPQAELRREELAETIPWLRTDLAAAKFDVEKLENPGFFQRLLGNPEKKLAVARKAVRDASTAHDAARRELAELEDRISKDNRELESLAGCREKYLQLLDQYKEDPRAANRKDQFLCTEAIRAASELIEALSGAHPSMRADVRFRVVSPQNRKLEFLAAADRHAQELQDLLAQLDPDLVTIGASLHCPSAYVTGATMEAAQLDRLNIAIEQARKARTALREHLTRLDAS